MSERIETVEKVRLKLWEALDGKGKKDPRVVAMVAQVEATLLLVEQQRIANLIALAKDSDRLAEWIDFLEDEAAAALVHEEMLPSTPTCMGESGPDINDDIKEALRL